MIQKVTLVFVLGLFPLISLCQMNDEYEVYALKYADAPDRQVQDIADGATSNESVSVCYMVWLLKGENGKNILVDAGFLDRTRRDNYVRPDTVLQSMDVNPSDITDIIITHPHWDHIGGINLFPDAKIWMQKADYDYFVGQAWQEVGFSDGFEKKDVQNIVEANLQGRLKLVEGDDIEIIPGIKAFIHSTHTFENQYLLVNSNSESNKVLIASDAAWYYYNLDHLLAVPTYAFDPQAYIDAMKRIKTLVTDPDLIIPGHDNLIFTKFPKINDRVVKIGK